MATSGEDVPWFDVTAAYVWAAKDRGLLLSPPKIKVCDTPLSQGVEKETLEDIASPGNQVCAQEIYKMTAALEAAGAISSQLPEVSDGDLARHMTSVSRLHRECFWISRIQGAERRGHQLNPYALLNEASKALGHKKLWFNQINTIRLAMAHEWEKRVTARPELVDTFFWADDGEHPDDVINCQIGFSP